MCSIDFFSSNEIQNELKCSLCDSEFDIPLILPCGRLEQKVNFNY
jgi:hypothetical protein